MPPVVLSAALSGAFAVVVALIAGWFSHAAGRRAGRGEFISAVQAAASEVIARLREEIDRLTCRCEAAEEHHRACRDELDALWAEVRAKPVPPYVNPKPLRRRTRKAPTEDGAA